MAGAALIGADGPFALLGYKFAPISREPISPTDAASCTRSLSEIQELPVLLAASLLEQHGVCASEVALVAEAAEPSHARTWVDRIQPKQHSIAGIVHPSGLTALPAELASFRPGLEVDHVLLLSAVSEGHVTAALFRSRD